MKTFHLFLCLLIGIFANCLSMATLAAKPPVTPARKPTPQPSPTATPASAVETPANDSVARWLLQQNGGKDAITLSLAEVVHATTGKNLLPIDPANPADAALIAKVGAVMDRLLPGMNKPESPAHVVGRTDEVIAFFEDALRAFVATVPGLSCPAAPEGITASLHTSGGFPVCRVVEAASEKSYYLGVTLYPTGGREAAVRALYFHPGEAAGIITKDGSCLLVAIECNGKTGKELAFLNWELLDLTKLPLHATTTFEASQGDAHPPGTLLNDGRKGRD